MLSILPLLFLGLVTCVVARVRTPSERRWDVRDGLLIGAVVTAVWAWAGAEGLSRFHEFRRVPVIIWWAVPVAGLSLWVRTHRPPAGSFRFTRPSRSIDFLLVGLASIILLVTGLMALLTPPTTHDSLCYHLPRQMYWIQNQTIAQYPSFDPRQIEMPPLAEYISAQLMLLSESDHQANMVQWFSFLFTALVASAIARDMGAGYRGQALAALLVVCNPAAATQAENAKNDIVVALWMMALFWAAVRIWVGRRCRIGYTLFVGAALGLLLLTKGTGCAMAPPICLMIGAAALRADWKRAIPQGAVMVALAVAINAPHWVRNNEALGSPFCLPNEKGGFALENEIFTPAALASNLVRNLTLHTCLPSVPANQWVRQRVVELHRHLGVSESDIRITSPRTMPFDILPDWNGDGNNAAPVHLLLGVAMVLGFRPGKLGRRMAWPAFLIPFGQILLFALLLKWQPWHVRLHIPIVSAAAVVLAVWMPRVRVLLLAAASAAFAVALAAVLYNNSKPLVGGRSIWGLSREEIMFRVQPDYREPLHEVARQVAKFKSKTLALDAQYGCCEYLILRVLTDDIVPPPRIVPLQTVLTMPPVRSEMPPCAIVRRAFLPTNIKHAASGTMFTWVSGEGLFRIYAPQPTADRARSMLPLPAVFGWDGW